MSQETVYFVRDDDVGELTDALRLFVDTFLERRIPVSYQIIPGQLTEDCAHYLVEMRAAHPDLIEFGQHGLHHAMTKSGRSLMREFGPELSLDQQRAVIAEGLDILHQRLGPEPPVRVFTPPQHKYDHNTVRAAAAVGHRVFSASYYPDAAHQGVYALGRAIGLSSLRHHGISYHDRARPEAAIEEISISLDVDDGEVLKRPAGLLAQALQQAERRTGRVGLMFHHGIYTDADKAGQLAAIADVIAGLDVTRLKKLGDLANPPGRSDAG
ncbi:MAG TPA: DUF2334 domain-containing protein [Caulobacteraceae bacterium]|nr:DUF2334 domain-containing protein [Caulobacteraceae bacterium]